MAYFNMTPVDQSGGGVNSMRGNNLTLPVILSGL